MGTKKLPFERNTTYDWQAPPDTPYIRDVANFNDMPETLQPALEAQYNRARERNANAYRSQYNQGGMTPAARLAAEREADRGLTADYGGALGQAAFDAKQSGLQRRMFLAGLTVPRPLATKEYGYQTEQAQPGFFSRLATSFAGGFGSGIGGAIKFSDERLKQNVQPQRPVLDRLDGFQAKEWDWENGQGHEEGVVAQDVDDEFPEAVIGEADGEQPMMVNYGDPSLAATALQGVKELNDKVESVLPLLRQRQMLAARRRA